MRESVDEHDVVGDLPLRQLAREEFEDRRLGRLPAVAWMDDQQRSLLPHGMRDCDDRGFKNVRMRHREVLDLDGGNPLAARLDDVLEAIRELDVAVRIDGADIARSEPPLCPPNVRDWANGRLFEQPPVAGPDRPRP